MNILTIFKIAVILYAIFFLAISLGKLISPNKATNPEEAQASWGVILTSSILLIGFLGKDVMKSIF